MILSARGVALGPLPPTDVAAASGEIAFVPVEGGQRADFLALILSGRMKPAAGIVTVDGTADPALLRRRVAVVDAPDASAPAAEIPLADVVEEELLFAGLRAPRRAARKLLADEHVTDHARTAIGDVPAAVRIRILARTAAARRGIDALVIVNPDRHGGDTASWLGPARAWSARGRAVVVLASRAALDAART